jgi:hypothetical protein
MIGAIDPAITPVAIERTICVHNWTATIRPPASYSLKVKRRLLPPGSSTRGWVLDHVVPLSLGGKPRDVRNLQLQTPAESHRKDRLEDKLHRMVCRHQITLEAAQAAFLNGWETSYRVWVR